MLKRIKDCKDLIIKADKTKNWYTVTPEEYTKSLQDEISKEYKNIKGFDKDLLHEVDSEAVKIASDLELGDRMKLYHKNSAFLTVKDHKGFENGIKHRLINPAKSDIGVISKKILQEKIEKVLQATGLNSWQSTQAVLDWYKQLPQDKNFSFLAFDIENYYPSIYLEILKNAQLCKKLL